MLKNVLAALHDTYDVCVAIVALSASVGSVAGFYNLFRNAEFYSVVCARAFAITAVATCCAIATVILAIVLRASVLFYADIHKKEIKNK